MFQPIYQIRMKFICSKISVAINRMADKLCLLVLICVVYYPSYSQQYHFERFGYNEGMPHTQVNDVVQGRDHKMYIATEEGLAVFDGREFEVFHRKEGLDSDDIHLLHPDIDGRIWVASSNGGLNYIHRDSAYAVPRIKSRLQGKIIYNIHQRIDSTLLFVTGLDVWAVGYDTIYSVWNQLQNPIFNQAGHLSTLSQDSLLYVNQPDGHFIKINLNTFEWSRAVDLNLVHPHILTITAGIDGRIYLNGDAGFVEYRADTFYTIHRHVPGRAYDLDVDKDGCIWVFSEGRGFGKYNPKNSHYKGYTEQSGMPTNVLFGGTIDHESNIWLATANEGLVRFRDESVMRYNEENGIPKNNVKAMASLGDTLFIGTQSGLVLLVDDKMVDTIFRKKFINSISSTPSHIIVSADFELFKIEPNLIIRSISKISGGQVFDKKGYLFRHNAAEMVVYGEHFTDTIDIGWVKDIAESCHHFILMLDRGIALYDLDTAKFLPELTANRYGSFRSMTQWSKDVLIKSDQHLHQIKCLDGDILITHHDLSTIPNIGEVNAITSDGDSLWFADHHQFGVLDIKRLTESGQLNYTTFPISRSFIQSSLSNGGIATFKNKVYVRSANGLHVFDPSKYIRNTQPAVLNIDAIYLFGTEIPRRDWDDQRLQLNSDENNLAIQMSAYTFANPSYVEFKYRLISANKKEDWIGPTSNHEVLLSNLSDGKYNFEFIANNGHGVWNTEPYRMSLFINKPIWKKPIFWIFSLFSVMVVVLLMKLNRNRKRLHTQRLFSTKLIDMQENERKRIARDLHDSVGQKIMLTALKAKEINATEISDLALSSLHETRSISQGLHPVILERLGLTEGLKDMITKVDDHTEILIDFRIAKIDHLIARENHIHIFRIIQELLSNCIKHARATTCSIQLWHDASYVYVIVEDNGIGMDITHDASGIGLTSIKDRVHIIGASYEITSSKGTRVIVRIPV